MKKITAIFSAQSSHSAADSESSGSHKVEINEGKFIENSDFLGRFVVMAAVSRQGDDYELKVDFRDDITVANAAQFVDDFATYLTYLLSFNNNHHYGSPYIEVDYSRFYRDNGESSSDSGIAIREHLGIQITQHKDLNNIDPYPTELPDLAHFYYLGMQSNNVKAKYFNLFLILEAVENSDLCKSRFPDGTLFTAEEKKNVTDVAAQMGDDRKKSTVTAVLSRTADSRQVKLHAVLNYIGIAKLDVLGTEVEVTLSFVKELLDARNKLFHKGHAIDEKIIWYKLIPLTRAIIQAILADQKLIVTTPKK